ncbi:MAG: serine/threonine-protein kinase [Gemmatimonadota bacterium]
MIDPADATASALARATDGQFRLEREIGRGGMGVVYLATDLRLERGVALKTLPPHLATDAAVRDRFVREARTAAALSHPNIVPIYHAAERDGVVYFAMGFVPGESLAERVARQGAIPTEDLVPVLVELADALGYAHERGVVHRDVKAENVLVDSRTGRAMVTDFGIARVTEAQPLTATGTVLGSVHYMSPEQVLGESLDGRSDLYALGVVAFFAITGRFPFERANSPAVLVAHVNSAPPRVHEYQPDAPDAIDEIVARLLEKRPDDRFANAAELIDALRGGTNHGVSAPPRAAVRPLTSPPATTPAAAPAPGAPASAPSLLSADDAQQVWARAAELQANTGVMVPPAVFAPRTGDAPVTTGYDVAVVRESAVDAGIDARYVDRALAERAEAGVPAATAVTPGQSMAQRPNIFIGSRSRIEFETVIDGEVTDAGFEEIADEIRSLLGEMVTVSSVGRTLTVTTTSMSGGRRSSMPRQMQVNVGSRGGRTRIQAFENMQQTAGATFGIGMGAIGGGAGGMMMGMIMGATQNPAIALPAWGAWMVTAYLGARTMFARTSRARQEELRNIVDRVAAVARVNTTSAVTPMPPRKLVR